MRNSRFKFRAWDFRVMSYSPIISDETDGGETAKVCLNHALFIHDGVIMQYTGRKDKNGTEVYEGDIVKIEHWTTLKVMTYIDRKMGFYPVDIKSGKAFEMNVSDAMYEVVGNVYENQELLGVKSENKACWC